METIVLERPRSTVLVSKAALVQETEVDCAGLDWKVEKANPYIQWIAGNFVEADKPNQNNQFWTAADLEVSEYTIRYSPLNMIHRWRQPIGFFAETRQVKLGRHLQTAGAQQQGSMKIQVLAGLWKHIFPEAAAAVDAANESGDLYFSMECTGSHLRCAGPNGCGKEFAYQAQDALCAHLAERTSIRHIVNPIFRGGAIIVPPTRPGWKGASASVLSDELLREAAAFAEHTESQYEAANSDGDLTPAAWEALMAMVIRAHS